MTSLRFSFVFLFAFGLLYISNGNPISNLFGKSSDDKAEADDKTTLSAVVKSAETTTTTATPEPSSSCGGLKGFLHICDKNAPTEPPKVVKTRSVSEEDDTDEDDDDDDSKSDEGDDDDDEDDSEEKTKVKEEEKQEPTETSPVSSEPTEGGIAKRQVGDPEAPILGETPPVVADAMEVPKKPEDEDKDVKKRQIDESESDSDEDEDEDSRRRRDCRDREGDYGKDCRRKREFVPSCFGSNCKNNDTTDAN